MSEATLLAKIKELEKRVVYLENMPAEYVPPPTYGPLPKRHQIFPEITNDQNQKLRDAIAKLNAERELSGALREALDMATFAVDNKSVTGIVILEALAQYNEHRGSDE